jgi:hypothetical protein
VGKTPVTQYSREAWMLKRGKERLEKCSSFKERGWMIEGKEEAYAKTN